MQNFFYFLYNHIFVSIIWIILFILVIVINIKNIILKRNILDSNKAVNFVNQGNAIFFDMRSYSDYCKGHIAGAINVSINDIKKENKNICKKYKNKLIILVYDTGCNVNYFNKILKNNGFQNVSILKGGMNSWNNNNLPIISIK